jgi:hypothetical protein
MNNEHEADTKEIQNLLKLNYRARFAVVLF